MQIVARPAKALFAAGSWSAATLLLMAMGAASAPEEKPPAKGEPFVARGRQIPYEDVLDHCDLVLAGKVTKRQRYQAELGLEQPEVLGRVELKVERALHGTYTNALAEIVHGTGNLGGVSDTNKVHVFMCLQAADGTLRLAGEPPLGGAHVWEGVPHMEKLLEAARDPAKGYQSSDFAVKLSSAYRLTRAWLAIPAEDRPAPPPRLMAVFLEGLWSYKHGLGRNADATAWNAINALFACDIRAIWDYPPAMKRGRRSKLATDVAAAWKRTETAVRERRAERSKQIGPDGRRLQVEVAALIEKLGSESYPERQAAHDALVKIGKPALKQVQERTKSENPRIASRCRLLVLLISQLRDFRPTTQSYIFNLDRAEPFVSLTPPKSDD
jgi:hypothetical protein